MRWLLSLLVIFALLLHNLPYLVRDQVVIWLRSQGVEHAALKALNVNWFSGEIELVELRAEREGHKPLNLDRLYLQLDYAALTEKRLLLRHIDIKGLDSGIVEQAPSLWLGPLDLNELASGDEQTSESEDSSGSAWLPGVDNIRLDDIRWYTAIAGQKHQLNIRQGELSDFHFWDKEQPTALNLEGSVNGAPLVLKTESTPLPEEKRSTLSINIQRFPLHSVTALIEPGLKATVDLDLQISAALKGESGQVQQSGSVRIQDLQLKQEALHLNQSDLTWSGDLAVVLKDGQPEKVSAKGQLKGAGLGLQQSTQVIGLDSYALGLDAVMQGAHQVLSQAGPLMLSGLDLQMGDLQLKHAQVNWDGSVGLTLNQGKPADLKVGGKLKGDGLALKQQKQNIRLAGYALQAQVNSVDMSNFDIRLPSTALNRFSLSVADNPLVAAQTLKVEQAHVALPLSVKTGAVALDDLLVLGEEQHLLKLSRTRLASVQFEPEKAALLGGLRLAGLDANVTLSKEGTLHDVEWLQAQLAPVEGQARTDAETEAEPEQASGDVLRISLSSLDLVGENQIRFTDQSTEPPFKSRIDLNTLSVGKVDTQTVAATPFNVQATLNQFAKLNLQGEAELAGSKHNGNWKLDLTGLELPPLSPYAERYTGYYLNSGQLSLDAEGTLSEGQLKGENKIRINRLTVDQRDGDKVAEFSQKITMPLETAIMVLEDNDNNINLVIPVSGSLDDPSFGYQSVINDLAGRGLKSAALSFLTKSLQPYATLISLASSAIDASEKGAFVTLNPVEFTPGSVALTGNSKGYLGKLAEMLNQRKAMRLNICGRAVPADAPQLMPAIEEANKKRKKPLPPEALQQELQAKLQELAGQRAAAVKEQMSASVDSGRLFLCFAQVDKSDDAKPRVELGL
ncbi:DUF748 domain-containing protein [Pontibacterium granulatum]|uniref:DUF748 domain-containing protein n=1 Tax=Pontibacterium granulatum TaxID=2036029 RepID=UPI00249AB2F5|nr:DUF748 domain-containing protein [Pontibacterium granulatum]MDI3325106.1 DUF748 domain-containing protein [Pontibacterium granulatum]